MQVIDPGKEGLWCTIAEEDQPVEVAVCLGHQRRKANALEEIETPRKPVVGARSATGLVHTLYVPLQHDVEAGIDEDLGVHGDGGQK